MNKKNLIKLLYSLSESEKKYRDHPEKRDDFFKKIYSSDFLKSEIPTFDLTNFHHENKFFLAGHEHGFFTHSNIEFAEHTRFSHPPLHRHHHIEMTYVYHGSCQQIIQNKQIELKAGDFCLLDSNVAHTIFDANYEDIIINIVMQKEFFNNGFLSRLANFSMIPSFILNAISSDNHQENYLILHANDLNRSNEIVEKMLLEYIRNDLYSQETIRSYMIIFLTNLLRDLSVIKVNTKQENSVVLSILKYIEDHFQTCTLQEVGEIFNYHPNYLANLLKEETGQTFKNLVIKQKINQAQNMLQNTDLPVNEIAENIGYKNLTFFYRKFREVTGMNPREFRNKN
ncbi:AraC family transcriptional regulator [Xylocopilactobacillus apicola]|uniref:AraC family transcriptional regulator n=1 Tax=Xylocopilactobacillus apicola TaxID=2932184 RepID=A0AAU9DXU3_9LACO|nr:helix-turn-helix domain-containing protein [Xylocopilactobacillus apicola]BDR58953.1 AraC family transcriptional regulator [Xylocopilactobacillus apicola]